MKRFDERLYAGVGQTFEISRELYSDRSAFQTIEVFENPVLGRVLVLDGVVQTTEADEFVYHEMLTHVPILAHGNVDQVLIVGGGDGGMLEEVLKHPVSKVTMVELDGQVVDVCREHLPSICGAAFEDPRTNLVIADGAELIANTADRYDVIIVDAPDPVGPAEVLFAESFYDNCRRRLGGHGVLVTQNGVPFLQGEEVRGSSRAFRALFPCWGFYSAPVPTYYGGHMAFGWASEALDMANIDTSVVRDRFTARSIDSRYYNPEIHSAAFALPTYIRDLTSA
ncbi:MAG: polyamine aminopropyltransferase [Proteobacteria bacterium]|nr:polyamine aminopropyltransferase [Pseudomonadota bacterium]